MSSTYLQSLRISNFRSFGAELTLDFHAGPGANVFVAPNGCGKTSLFEAIELVLARSSKRVTSDLDVLIRSGSNEGTAELAFTEGRQAGVRLRKGTDFEWHHELPAAVLGAKSTADVASLLRLTHLFYQRENLRPVVGDRKERGAAVSHAVEFRELDLAYTQVPKVKRWVTSRTSDLTADLKNCAEALTRWQRHLSRYEELRKLLSDQSMTAGEIEQRLEQLFQRPWAQGISIGRPLEPSSLAAVRVALVARIEAEYERLARRERAFRELASVITDWPEAVAAERAASATCEVIQNSASALMEEVSRCARQAKNAEEELERLARRETETELSATKAAALARSRTAEASAKADVTAGRLAMDELRAQLDVAEAAFAEARARTRRHSLLQQEKARLSLERDEATSALAAWREAELAKTQEHDHLSEQARRAEKAIQQKDEIAQKIRDESATHSATTRRVDSLKARLSSIRAAISTIAQHLPDDASSCPICQSQFDAAELRRRLLEASRDDDADLEPMMHEARRIEARLAALREEDAEVAAVIADCLSAKSLAEAKLASLDEIVTRSRRALEFHVGVLPDGVAHVRQLSARIEARLHAIEGELSSLPPEPDAHDHEEHARTNAVRLRTERDDAERRISDALHRQTMAASATSSLIRELGGDSDDKAIADALHDVRNAIAAATRTLQEARNAHAEARDRCHHVEEDVARAMRARDSARSRIAALQASWSAAALPNHPDSAILQGALDSLVAERLSLDSDTQTLRGLADAIAWHTSSDELARVRVDIIHEAQGEEWEARTERLQNEHAAIETELDRLRELSAHIGALEGPLKRELDTLHNEVAERVLPVQHQLLKAIGRSRRLPKLKFMSRYNSPTLETTVDVHGSGREIDLVASEAEYADFALTFQVAFALTRRWCSWPALLLDDPTQHHDIPHAAAVFDLLTELAAVHRFQIFVATQDPGMARFVCRRFEADGLPTRVWQLQPGDAGTIAHMING